MPDCVICGMPVHAIMDARYGACSPTCGEIRELRTEVAQLRAAIRQYGRDTDGARNPRDFGLAYARLLEALDV